MPLKVLQPTRFDGYLEQGGSTKPWKVFLLENGNEVPYVVKLFTPRNIEQQHAVAKEVYGNELARHFCLSVPDMALVNFDKNFLENAIGNEERAFLKKKDSGYKFSCKLADSMSIFTPTLHKKFLKDYDLANVFAFDSLTFNLDRGGLRNKPNLILDDENFLLIDHEQTFPFADNEIGMYNKIISDFGKDNFMYPFQRHLFYPYLKEMRTQDKKHLFDEFEQNLSKVRPAEIQQVTKELERFNVSVGHYDRIINYLYKMQQNPAKFCNILLSSIA